VRPAAYITLLLAILVVSLAAIALGLDGLLEHPPFIPHALLAGAYFGAISAVSLAEEAAEWIGRGEPPVQKTTSIMPARLTFIGGR
jgi:hypothetical protein